MGDIEIGDFMGFNLNLNIAATVFFVWYWVQYFVAKKMEILGPYVLGSIGGASMLFWWLVLFIGAIDEKKFKAYAFVVPFWVGTTNAIGYWIAGKLGKPELQHLIAGGGAFCGNVVIGLVSGYASQYPGMAYVFYLCISASLYAVVYLVILKMVESDARSWKYETVS